MEDVINKAIKKTINKKIDKYFIKKCFQELNAIRISDGKENYDQREFILFKYIKKNEQIITIFIFENNNLDFEASDLFYFGINEFSDFLSQVYDSIDKQAIESSFDSCSEFENNIFSKRSPKAYNLEKTKLFARKLNNQNLDLIQKIIAQEVFENSIEELSPKVRNF